MRREKKRNDQSNEFFHCNYINKMRDPSTRIIVISTIVMDSFLYNRPRCIFSTFYVVLYLFLAELCALKEQINAHFVDLNSKQ